MVGDYPKITYRKHTFLSALVMGLAGVIIALIISGTVVITYGMYFAGEKSEQLFALVEDAVRGLPNLQKSLPPAFADMLDDQRQPDYSSQLEITAKTAAVPEQDGKVRTSITVVNKGQEVISLLALRVVVLNGAGEIVGESNEWAATPFAADDDWRGPMLPGARRYFSCSHDGHRAVSTDQLKPEVEVTDLRIWGGVKEGSEPATAKPSEPKPSDAPAAPPTQSM